MGSSPRNLRWLSIAYRLDGKLNASTRIFDRFGPGLNRVESSWCRLTVVELPTAISSAVAPTCGAIRAATCSVYESQGSGPCVHPPIARDFQAASTSSTADSAAAEASPSEFPSR